MYGKLSQIYSEDELFECKILNFYAEYIRQFLKSHIRAFAGTTTLCNEPTLKKTHTQNANGYSPNCSVCMCVDFFPITLFARVRLHWIPFESALRLCQQTRGRAQVKGMIVGTLLLRRCSGSSLTCCFCNACVCKCEYVERRSVSVFVLLVDGAQIEHSNAGVSVQT